LFAWLLIASGVAMILGMRVPIFGTGLINGLWLMLIGWFLNTAAVASYRQMQSRHLLQGVPVRRVMQTQPRTVGPELSLQELVDHYLFQGEQRAYPVVSDEHLEGLVTLQEIRSVPRANWSDTPVKQVMVASADLVTVGPDNDAAEALERISQRGFNQLPVTADQRLEGLIYRQDLMRWLSLFSQD
jgi:CBS domain-containing protein